MLDDIFELHDLTDNQGELCPLSHMYCGLFSKVS